MEVIFKNFLAFVPHCAEAMRYRVSVFYREFIESIYFLLSMETAY